MQRQCSYSNKVHRTDSFIQNLQYIQDGPKKSLIHLQKKRLRISKRFFDKVFFSIYSHLLKKLELSKLCRKNIYGDLKIPKMVKFKKKIFFKLTTRKIFDYKEIFFLSYVAKSISFEDISVLKINGQIDNIMTSIAIFNL